MHKNIPLSSMHDSLKLKMTLISIKNITEAHCIYFTVEGQTTI